MILDTCALLWLAQGGGKITPETLQRINDATAVYLSAITGFEIALKSKGGKLQLPASVQDWLTAIVEHHDLSVVPLDMDLCAAAVSLPDVHSDPCDRFIIATAQRLGCPVVTADTRFADYGVDVCL